MNVEWVLFDGGTNTLSSELRNNKEEQQQQQQQQQQINICKSFGGDDDNDNDNEVTVEHNTRMGVQARQASHTDRRNNGVVGLYQKSSRPRCDW